MDFAEAGLLEGLDGDDREARVRLLESLAGDGYTLDELKQAAAEDRLALARAAFPGDDVRLDPYPRTVELLRAEQFDDPVFVVGADQFREFLDWSEPEEVLERTRIAVATRPGFPRPELDAVVEALARPERVLFFEIEPNPAASTDVRARAATGNSLDGLVPPGVAELIEARGLYRP